MVSSLFSRLLLALTLFLWLPLAAIAQDDAATEAETTAEPAEQTDSNIVEGARVLSDELVEVQTGAYVLRVGNVSPQDSLFEIDMWMWFRWQGADIRPDLTFELANGIITERTDTELLNDEGYNYSTMRILGTIFHDFDVRRFPMDNHVLTIDIEDSLLDHSQLVYVVDEGSALDPQVNVPGWNSRMDPAYTGSHTYETTYGMRSAGTDGATYSRFTIPIVLERFSYGPLFKSFWISLLAVILALLALLVKAEDLDARYGMGVGSIFAASANAFVISESLPQTNTITLAEQINLLAVGVIFITVFVSVWSLRLCYAGRHADSIKLDRVAMFSLAIIYVLLNVAVLAFEFL